MATTLDVVNDCLASLGEAPLSTLSEPHEYRGAALAALAKANRKIQSPGWWFNTEATTMSPAPVTGHMQLAGDVIRWVGGVRTADTLTRGLPTPWVVQRGSRLYDTRTHTFTMTEDVVGEVVREIPFEDLPPVINDYVAAEAVLRFQSNFDADNSRRQELDQAMKIARTEARAEDIRQLKVNLLNNNSRLSRIKRVTRSLRY